MIKRTESLIFDFDGTVADTLPYTFSKIIEIAKKYQVKEKDKLLIKKISQLTPKELMKEFKISWFKIPFVLWEIRKAQNQLFFHIDKVKIFPGVKKLLKELRKKEIKLYIYSSNLKKNIERFLKKQRIKDFFEKVYVGRNLLGKDKDLLAILKKEGFKKNEVYYVADEIRDVLACQKAKIKMIGVCWGLSKEVGLKKVGVDFLVKKPEEILKII